MSKDDLGDRMKEYEGVETSQRFDIARPIYARIDGRGFSRFTRGMERPFDPRMAMAMQETTRHLVERTGARLGYTQSDKISLAWVIDLTNPASQMIFDGKVQKICSVLASLATAAFSAQLPKVGLGEFANRLPHFDARAFNVPSLDEAANAFLWRELDATRNAVSMAAYANFSPKTLHGVSVREMRKRLLNEVGIDFETVFPDYFKRGMFFQRVTSERTLTPIERERIPEKNRPAADAVFTRSQIDGYTLMPLLQITNRVEVLFEGAAPIIKSEVEAA